MMERKTRFELATLALARRCSTPEPLPHDCNSITNKNCFCKAFFYVIIIFAAGFPVRMRRVPVAQLYRASDSDSEGRGLESRRAHHAYRVKER